MAGGALGVAACTWSCRQVNEGEMEVRLRTERGKMRRREPPAMSRVTGPRADGAGKVEETERQREKARWTKATKRQRKDPTV